MIIFEEPKLNVYEIQIEDVLTVSGGGNEQVNPDLDQDNIGKWT